MAFHEGDLNQSFNEAFLTLSQDRLHYESVNEESPLEETMKAPSIPPPMINNHHNGFAFTPPPDVLPDFHDGTPFSNEPHGWNPFPLHGRGFLGANTVMPAEQVYRMAPSIVPGTHTTYNAPPMPYFGMELPGGSYLAERPFSPDSSTAKTLAAGSTYTATASPPPLNPDQGNHTPGLAAYAEASQPQAAYAEASQPQAAYAEASQPQAAYAEASQPQAAYAEASQPQAAYAEASQPQAAYAEASQPQAAYAEASQPQAASEAPADPLPPVESSAARRAEEDGILMECRRQGMTYSAIRKKLGTNMAESTLRGRVRQLTLPPRDRERKPAWSDKDIELLKRAVPIHRKSGGRPKVLWEQVGRYIPDHGGSRKFSGKTCHAKFREVTGRDY